MEWCRPCPLCAKEWSSPCPLCWVRRLSCPNAPHRSRACAGSVAAGISWCRRHVETLQLLVFCPQLGTLALGASSPFEFVAVGLVAGVCCCCCAGGADGFVEVHKTSVVWCSPLCCCFLGQNRQTLNGTFFFFSPSSRGFGTGLYSMPEKLLQLGCESKE
jgi:hypothetical protein